MNAVELGNLLRNYGEREVKNYIEEYYTYKHNNVFLEAVYYPNTSWDFPTLQHVEIYTRQPEGEHFSIYGDIIEGRVSPVEPTITIKIGAWCYTVWMALQHLEDLDKAANEKRQQEIEEKRNKVHNWFLENINK